MVEMVEVFIRTSNEKPVFRPKRFGIHAERRGKFPGRFSGFGVETAEHAVEAPEKIFETVASWACVSIPITTSHCVMVSSIEISLVPWFACPLDSISEALSRYWTDAVNANLSPTGSGGPH